MSMAYACRRPYPAGLKRGAADDRGSGPEITAAVERTAGGPRSHATGDDSAPELRLQELAIFAQATRYLTENSALSGELTDAVDRLVSSAKRDIAVANREALSVQSFSATVLIAAVALSLLSSILIVWLYVGRSIVSRLTALSHGMLAIAEGNLQAHIPSGGSDEIAEMGRVVEILRKNTLQRDELLVERAEARRPARKAGQGTNRGAEHVGRRVASARRGQSGGEFDGRPRDRPDTIVAKAAQLSSTDAGAIYVFDDGNQEFRLRATYGMDDAIIAAIKDRHIHIGETAIGEAVEQRIPIQIPDVQKDPSSLVLDVIVRAGFRALLIVPLLGPDVSSVRWWFAERRRANSPRPRSICCRPSAPNRCWRSRTRDCSARSRRKAASSQWRASTSRSFSPT